MVREFTRRLANPNSQKLGVRHAYVRNWKTVPVLLAKGECRKITAGWRRSYGYHSVAHSPLSRMNRSFVINVTLK